MEQVIVEWRAEQPYTPQTLRDASVGGSWCHRLHGVSHRRSYLGADGQRIVCVFAAPDAEAVRRAGRQAGSSVHTVWPATVFGNPDTLAPGPDDDGRAVVLVARSFAEPVAFETLQKMADAGVWCLEANAVRHLRSYFAPSRKRMLCVYDAPDAEAVRRAQRQIGMPYDTAWTARLCHYASGQPTPG